MSKVVLSKYATGDNEINKTNKLIAKEETYSGKNVFGNSYMPKTRTIDVSDAEKKSVESIDIDELYNVAEAVTPALSTGFRLLAKGLTYIEEAAEADREDNSIAADDAVQRLHALLPELFCCRSIGDGFGAIVVAILSGLHDFNGLPLNSRQIDALGKALRKIRNEPFLCFDAAVDEIMDLEDAGFTVEPPGFGHLAEALGQ